VEIEPAQSVLDVLQKLAWTCSTRYVAKARPQLTFSQKHYYISFMYVSVGPYHVLDRWWR